MKAGRCSELIMVRIVPAFLQLHWLLSELLVYVLSNTIKGTIAEYVFLEFSASDGRRCRDLPTPPIVDILEDWKQKHMTLERIPLPDRLEKLPWQE